MTDVVERYFAAMRRGPDGGEDLFALFTEDAVYDEPFTDVDEPAVGKAAVVQRFRLGWETPLPDLELDVLGIEVVGDRAVSRWECRSSAFPAPVRGEDRYLLRDGRIARLEVTITDPGDG